MAATVNGKQILQSGTFLVLNDDVVEDIEAFVVRILTNPAAVTRDLKTTAIEGGFEISMEGFGPSAEMSSIVTGSIEGQPINVVVHAKRGSLAANGDSIYEIQYRIAAT